MYKFNNLFLAHHSVSAKHFCVGFRSKNQQTKTSTEEQHVKYFFILFTGKRE